MQVIFRDCLIYFYFWIDKYHNLKASHYITFILHCLNTCIEKIEQTLPEVEQWTQWIFTKLSINHFKLELAFLFFFFSRLVIVIKMLLKDFQKQSWIS